MRSRQFYARRFPAPAQPPEGYVTDRNPKTGQLVWTSAHFIQTLKALSMEEYDDAPPWVRELAREHGDPVLEDYWTRVGGR